MTTPKPCDEIKGLRCAHGGYCWGRHYFGGKAQKTPLHEVRVCEWRDVVLERHRREGEK